jgi:hypothetical protein
MWLLARYRPGSLFSLRSSLATSSGGRANLVPSMYSVKLALIDASFRARVSSTDMFRMVARMRICLEGPPRIVVNNAFARIRREPKDKKEGWQYISSVGYREFCYYHGDLTIALDVSLLVADERAALGTVLAHISYLGKRGSFFQLMESSLLDDDLPASFSTIVGDNDAFAPRDLIVQYLDDFGPGVTFERVNTFSSEPQKMGRDRVLLPVVLPYRLSSSSRGYTTYERTVR